MFLVVFVSEFCWLAPRALQTARMSFWGKAAEEGNRLVFANKADQPLWSKANIITNTKYTLLNFVPYNLAEQFRCVSSAAVA